MNGFKNWAACLTNDALLLLFTFDHHGELLMPHAALNNYLPHERVNKAISELRRWQLLRTKSRPYKLTALGTKVIKMLNQEYVIVLNKDGAQVLLRTQKQS